MVWSGVNLKGCLCMVPSSVAEKREHVAVGVLPCTDELGVQQRNTVTGSAAATRRDKLLVGQ